MDLELPAPSPNHEPLAQLLRWAKGHGAVAPKLGFAPVEPRHFLAADSIAAGEPIITLPQHLLMHAGTALADPVYGPAFCALKAEMDSRKDRPGMSRPDTASDRGAPTSVLQGEAAAVASTDAKAPSAGTSTTEAAVVPRSYWDAGGLGDRDLLCMLLIVERARGTSSYWAPYIDILPPEYDDPAWWDGPALSLLRGTRVARAAEAYRPGLELLAGAMRRLREIHLQHQQQERGNAGDVDQSQGDGGVASGVSGAEGGDGRDILAGWACSLEAARWARSAVWSRSFTVRRLRGPLTAGKGHGAKAVGGEVEGQDGNAEERPLTVCQVPVLDMIDHQPGCVVAWHTGPRGDEDFVWLKMEDVAKGSVLYNNYGSKDNQELLLAYGFVLSPNPNDYVSLSIKSNAPAAAVTQQATRAAAGDDGGGEGGPGKGRAEAMEAQEHGQEIEHGAGGGAEVEEQDEEEEEEEEVEEEDVQGPAEAIQRRLVAAAAGLPVEFRLTLADPLPERLLQATRVALASGARLYFAAAAALMPEQPQQTQQSSTPSNPAAASTHGTATAGTPNTAAAAAGPATAGACGAPAFASARPAIRDLLQPYDAVSELRVLGTVAQQLELRLAAIVDSEDEVLALLGLEEPGPDGPGAAQTAPLLLPDTGWLPPLPLVLPSLASSSESERDRSAGSGMASAPGAVHLAGCLRRWLGAQDAAADQLGLGRHARLALAVVNGQRAILLAARRTVAERMGRVLQDACTAALRQLLCSNQTADDSLPVGGSTHAIAPDVIVYELPHANPRSLAGPLVSQDETQTTAEHGKQLGQERPLRPSRVAVRVRHDCAMGQEVLRVPLGCCLVAADARQLLEKLLLIATRERLLAPTEGASGRDHPAGQAPLGGEEPSSQPAKGAVRCPEQERQHQQQLQLARLLLRHVPPAPAVRRAFPAGCPLPCPDGARSDEAARARGVEGPEAWGSWIEHTPVCSELDATAEALQADFLAFRSCLAQLAQARSQASATPASSSAPSQRNAAPHLRGPPGQEDWSEEALVAFLRAPSEHGFWLYAWAREVVEHCAVEALELQGAGVRFAGRGEAVDVSKAAAAPPLPPSAVFRQHLGPAGRSQRRLLAVAPLLWVVPQELRSAAFRVECRPTDASEREPVASRSNPADAHHTPLQLVVTAACPLPAGLLLHPDSLATPVACRDAEWSLVRHGPMGRSGHESQRDATVAKGTSVAVQVEAAGDVSGQEAQQTAMEGTGIAERAAEEDRGQVTDAAGGSGGGEEPRSGSGGILTADGSQAAEPASMAPAVHSLEVLPDASTSFGAAKLRLMRECGLGSVHYLGPGGQGYGLVTGVLRLSLLAEPAPLPRQQQKQVKKDKKRDSAAASADSAAAAALLAEAAHLGAVQGCGRGPTRAFSACPAAEASLTRDAARGASAGPHSLTRVQGASCIQDIETGAGSSAGGGAAPNAGPSTQPPPGPGPDPQSGPGHADLELLATGRRVVSRLLGSLPENCATSKAARKALRSEIKNARGALPPRMPGLPMKTSDVTWDGALQYFQSYIAVLDEWRGILESPPSFPGFMESVGGGIGGSGDGDARHGGGHAHSERHDGGGKSGKGGGAAERDLQRVKAETEGAALAGGGGHPGHSGKRAATTEGKGDAEESKRRRE